MEISLHPAFKNSFTTFGDLLKYLRRRQHLTQLELSITVGYSEAQISRLEKNLRPPDLAALQAVFIPALHLDEEPQLAARFLELAESARQEDAPTPGIAPYKGLLFFDESDSELFFGREALTEQLVRHVKDLALNAPTRFLAVVGASGSGKSSLVRAGLAVSLQRLGWDTRVFAPTANPLGILEANLEPARLTQAEYVLILVDQFEELFTRYHRENERTAFIDKLLSCAQEKSKQFTVVVALRADFYARCAQYPALREVVSSEQEYIGQMTTHELRRAIEEPAVQGGWQFDPGLVDILLNDIGAQGSGEPEPGALPLLSHALLVTWERRRGRVLTLEGYRASGGVRGAIAETAESVFTDQLNQTQQEIAREVFLRLTELGDGTEDTRRRVALNELARKPGEATQLRAVLNTLAEARLITINESSAEVAHEALIREWQRLREWLAQDRESLLLHRHLTESAQEWKKRECDPAELYRGARLAQAREWATANTDRLNPAERDFLAASIDLEQHEALEREAQRLRELEAVQRLAAAERRRAEEQRQAAVHLRRRAVLLSLALAAAFLLVLVAAAFAQQARQNFNARQTTSIQAISATSASPVATTQDSQAKIGGTQAQSAVGTRATAEEVAVKEGESAQAQTRQETARELASAALDNLKVDQQRSLLLAMQAVKSADIPEAESALHQAVLASRLRDTLPASASPLYGIAVLPKSMSDARRFATASQDGTIKIWEMDETGIRVKTSPLVTISNPTDFELWSDATGYALAFSPDGKQLAAIGSDHTAKIWDAASGELLQTLYGHSGNVYALAFNPDGELLATDSQDGTAKIWDVRTGRELQTLTRYTTEVVPLAFSPDGKRLACADFYPGKVMIWERIKEPGAHTSSGQFVQSFSIDSQFGRVAAVAFSQDGKQVAIGFNDIKVYDISSATATSPAQLVQHIPVHEDNLNGLYFDASQKRLISSSADGTVKVWDVATGLALFTLAGNAGRVTSVSGSSDTERLFTAHSNGQVKVWDLSIQGSQEWLAIPGMSAGFLSRAGDRILTLNSDPDHPRLQVLQLSPEGGREISSISLVHGSIDTKFDADQGLSRAVTLYHNDYIVHVWDLASGQELSSFSIEKTPTQDGYTANGYIAIKLSPDGTRLVSGGSDGSAFLWDVQTGKPLHTLTGNSDMFDGWDSLAFSPDGSQVATANYDGRLSIWDVNNGTLIRILKGHSGPWPNVSFSPDGKRLLSTSIGESMMLWDLQTGRLLRKLPGSPFRVNNLEVSPDGKYLAAARVNGTVQLWDAVTGQELFKFPGVYVKFSGDGKHLLAYQDGVIYGFTLDINELMALARARLTRTWTSDECSQYLHTSVCPPAS